MEERQKRERKWWRAGAVVCASKDLTTLAVFDAGCRAVVDLISFTLRADLALASLFALVGMVRDEIDSEASVTQRSDAREETTNLYFT